jgi:hypothetical protein
MPFVSLELPHIADIDPKVDCDSRRVLYFSQTRYGLFISSLTFGLPLSVINRRCSLFYIRMALLDTYLTK